MGLLIRSILLLAVLLSFPNDTVQAHYAFQPMDVTAISEFITTSASCLLDHLPLAIFDGTMNLYAWNSNSWAANYELNTTVRTAAKCPGASFRGSVPVINCSIIAFQVQVWKYVATSQWSNMKELTDGIIRITQENNEHMLKYVQAHPDQFTPLFQGVQTNYVEFTKAILTGFIDHCKLTSSEDPF